MHLFKIGDITDIIYLAGFIFKTFVKFLGSDLDDTDQIEVNEPDLLNNSLFTKRER